MHLDTLDAVKQLAIEVVHMPVVRDMLFEHFHLSASDARADVGHTVVVAYLLVLIVGICLTCLGSVEHDFLLALRVRADQRASPGSRNHLVAIEREDAEPSEGAADLSVKTAAEAFGRILDDRDAVLLPHRDYLVNPSRHAIQINRNDRLGLSSGFRDSVVYRLLEQLWIHVPGVRLRVYEHRGCPEVAYGVGRGAERETLHQHLVSRTDTAGNKGKVHRSSTGREGHHFPALADERLQFILERIDIWPERHDPVSVERLPDILHFRPAHVGETEVDTVVHGI